MRGADPDGVTPREKGDRGSSEDGDSGGGKDDGEGMIEPGTKVDHFQVRRLLGKGGMGEVYLARDTQLGRRVALKVILPDALKSEQAVKRFMREAQITARFNHPHIVMIYSVGRYQGSPYLALEYLPGQNLRDRLEEERLGEKEALRIALAVAEAVAEAHRHGVLHRDLKPGNVLVPRDGRIRVLDFGLSRTTRVADKAPVDRSMREADLSRLEGLSAAGLGGHEVFKTAGKGIRGTPAYMAPEQWREVTEVEATDVWALGLIMYELLAGRHPYEGKTFFNICLSVCEEEPVPSVGLHTMSSSPELVQLVDRCLSKDPLDRPRAEEVVEALSALVAGAPRPRGQSEQNPFRGLMPFSERHADQFFGREAEIAAFLERLRDEPLLPVVGPSGAGKSSFVQAGVIPRLREQGPWVVLRMRPGRRPFETLASRLVSGDSLDRGDTEGSVGSRGALSASTVVRRRGALRTLSSTTHASASERPSKPAPSGLAPSEQSPSESWRSTSGPSPPKPSPSLPPSETWPFLSEPSRFPSGSSREAAETEGRTHDAPIERIARELEQSPARLSLLLNQLVDLHGARVLLFVDQLEELYTLVPTDEVRQAFLEALCWAADDPESGVRVVITLRDDFLGRLASGGGAHEALSRVLVLGTPGPEALREILRRPVDATGYSFEDDSLVEEMVRAVEGEPAALPLLQFTGQVLWEQRDRESHRLTRQAYLDAGGVAGALAKHADGVLDGMSPEQEQIARQIFLRLVTPEGTRQVLPRSELLEGLGPMGRQVLDRLATERAVMVRKGFAEAELELVHESLIRKWDRLSRWLDESRDERAFLAEIGQAATLWERRDRLREEVWQGEALAEALRRAARCRSVPALVSEFLRSGERREARRLWRRRASLAAGAVLLIAIAVASLGVSWALRRKEQLAQRSEQAARLNAHEARRQRQRAVRRQSEAQREGARAALMRSALIEARAKLRGSLQSLDSTLGRALWWRMQKNPLQLASELGGVVFSVAISPSGARVAVGCQDHAIYLFDVQTGAVQTLRGHEDQVFSVAFSPDGRLLASASWDGVIRLWDTGADQRQGDEAGRAATRVLHGHQGGVRSVSFSPDGRLLATGSMDQTVRLWKVGTGEIHAVLRGHTADVLGVRFSPDGRLLATASRDGTARLWKVISGESHAVLAGHRDTVWNVDFHPGGAVLGTASSDDSVRLWRADSGKPIGELRGHGGGAHALSFHPDGKLLAAGGRDGRLRLWRWEDRALEAELPGHRKTIVSVAYSRDGHLVASGSYDHSVRLWRPSGRSLAMAEGGHREAVVGADFDPSARLLATGGYDHEIRLWEVASGTVARVLKGHESAVYAVRFSPDGEQLASASTDRTVRLWQASTGQAAGVLRGHDGAVADVCFSPDGNRIASASFDKTVRLWDRASKEVIGALRGHTGPVWTVAFHPKNGQLATGSEDGTIRIWDSRTLQQLRLLSGHDTTVTGVDFDPAGRYLVSGSRDQTVRLWDLQSGTHRVLGRGLGRVFRVAFRPTGGMVGVASSDGTARLWDLGSEKVRVLRGHQAEVNQVRFSPDGMMVATGGDDSTARLWSVGSGSQIWRASLLDGGAGELFTHRGRIPLGSKAPGRPPEAGWQRAVDQRAGSAALSEDGALLCLGTLDGRLEIWDRRTDRTLAAIPTPGLRQVLAWSRGCVTLSRRGGGALRELTVRHHDQTGANRTLVENARAIALDRTELLVATPSEVQVYSRPGDRAGAHPVGMGVTALTRIGDWLVLGFGDGNVELHPVRKGLKAPRFTFEGVPSSPVTRLLPGPTGTLIAGFANGLVGLWTIQNGTLLEQGRLHGAILHLQLRGPTLHAASELGQHLKWDLGVFHQSYCELLGQVWRSVPVIWEQGLPKVSPPPKEHPCHKSR